MQEPQYKLRHDFINNALRIEVLNNLLVQSLEGGKKIPAEETEDLLNFLQNHIDYIKQLQS